MHQGTRQPAWAWQLHAASWRPTEVRSPLEEGRRDRDYSPLPRGKPVTRRCVSRHRGRRAGHGEYLQEARPPRLGHEVVAAAENGRQLVEQCRIVNRTGCIADVKMPEVDGIEAATGLNLGRGNACGAGVRGTTTRTS